MAYQCINDISCSFFFLCQYRCVRNQFNNSGNDIKYSDIGDLLTRICSTADYVVEANNIPIVMCHHYRMLSCVHGAIIRPMSDVIPTRFPLVVNLMWSIHKHSLIHTLRLIISLQFYDSLTKNSMFSTEP